MRRKSRAEEKHTASLISEEHRKASRSELFIRIPYFLAFYIILYVALIVFMIWGVWAGIAFVFNWLHILFLGKRSKFLSEQVRMWYDFGVRIYVGWIWNRAWPYFLLLTDKRPGFNI
jgi:hypothetical protein